MENKILRYALIVSLLVHIIILWNLTYVNIRLREEKSPRAIKVTYSTAAFQKKVALPKIVPQQGMKVDLARQVKTSRDEQRNISSFMKDISKRTNDFIRQVQKPKALDEKNRKRKVTVPPVETLQIKNPLYVSYYQIVRNRIKDRAYSNYVNSGKFDAGEVYLAFMLDSSGALKEIHVTEERTRANQHLRQVSIRSIQESSSFPPFPQELNYPELSFNVVISYEVE
jgi:hypothetical protein